MFTETFTKNEKELLYDFVLSIKYLIYILINKNYLKYMEITCDL